VPNEVLEFDSTYNQNIVFEQDPEAGSILESLAGEELSSTIYISKGERTFEMPVLTGLDLAMAESIIDNLELVLEEVVYGYDSTQPTDIIFGQDPVPGSQITISTKVTLFISQGEDPEGTIPDVIGMTEEDAVGLLNTLGYFNISITIEENEEEINKVFNQVPETGTIYDKANEIVLRISSGIEVPDVFGLDLADALISLEGLDFLVEILPDPGATGEVIDQIPAAGEFMDYGSTVTIEVEEPAEGGDGDGDGDGGG
jgi:serine/threonine-protein kinase